jgi:hypothetical protein
MASATTVTLSYPSDLSTWGRDIVEDEPFRSYLRKAHDSATAGDSWAEFVGVGCCGDSLDVTLRVESVEGGPELGPETAFEFTEREACGVGGWQVQSAAGPA